MNLTKCRNPKLNSPRTIEQIRGRKSPDLRCTPPECRVQSAGEILDLMLLCPRALVVEWPEFHPADTLQGPGQIKSQKNSTRGALGWKVEAFNELLRF